MNSLTSEKKHEVSLDQIFFSCAEMFVYSNTCRFCLILVDKENVSLFCDDSPTSLPRKIMDIADVKVSKGDGLPSVVCPSCFAQLELSYQFKLQVEKADKILREEISLNAVLPSGSETVECSFEMVKCEIVDNENAKTGTHFVFEEESETVERSDDEIVKLASLGNENVGTGTNCVFEEENNTAMCALEDVRTGADKEMLTRETEENHKNDGPGKMINKPNEENNKMGYNCETNADITYRKDLYNDVQKDTESARLKGKMHKCEMCDASFRLRRMLKFHMLLHNEIHKCKKCGKEFTGKPEMESHYKIHLKEHLIPATCKTCGKVYKTRKGLESHIKHQHSGHFPLTCTTCGKQYKRTEGLRSHVRKQHTDDGFSYICEICGKCYTDKPSLRYHKVRHTEVKQPSTCEICKKTYPHARALRVHKRFVHLVLKRLYCDICGKDFKHPIILKRHKEIHSGERPHTCRICGFASAWRGAVRTHMKVHTGLESYNCEHCGQGFKWKQTYDKHVLKCSEKLSTLQAKSTEMSNTVH